MTTEITTNNEIRQDQAADQQITLATMMEAMRSANDAAGANAATIGSNASSLSVAAGEKMTDGMLDALSQIETKIRETDVQVDINDGLAEVARVMQDAPQGAANAVLALLHDQAQLGPSLMLDFVANAQRQLELVRKVNGAELVSNSLPVFETVTKRLTPEKVQRIRDASDAIAATEDLLGDIDDLLPEKCGKFPKFNEPTVSECARRLAKSRKK